jgi:AraC-like DNA-binding protein
LDGSDTVSFYREVHPPAPHPFIRCWWEQRVGERADGYVQRVRSLVDLAASAGYADQAHLSREARALSGLTPSVLLAERRRPRSGEDGPSAR